MMSIENILKAIISDEMQCMKKGERNSEAAKPICELNNIYPNRISFYRILETKIILSKNNIRTDIF